MDRYYLQFDRRPYANLWQFALMARQDRNLGNLDRWFQSYVAGYQGLLARLKGAEVHYGDIHAWRKVCPKDPLTIEYHFASIFFNMVSSLECFVFALNSLGYAIDKGQFKNISTKNGLWAIGLSNIIGSDKDSCIGYDKYFPHTKEFMLNNKELLDIIKEQHDVSKHRQAIFRGGKCRSDPPEGFFKEHGIEDNPENRVLYAPFAEIMLLPEPKTPESKRKSKPYKKHDFLEDIGPRFCTFMNELGCKALNDAQIRITPML